MNKKIRKAVFPVAGLGTRFLPATKASPKEMLPVVDKPLIQYAAEEAIEAGITELIFIMGRNKGAITNHFDKAYELEAELESKGKTELLQIARNVLPAGISCIFIRQNEPLGLGHAVWCAKSVTGDEPFAVILADDLIDGRDAGSGIKQMVDVYNQHECSVIAAQRVAQDDTYMYGIFGATATDEKGVSKVNEIVEKPDPKEAPSNLAVVGRYILTPKIMDLLETTGKGAGGEIQLTDAISDLLQRELVMAYEIDGKRYDCGSKLGYLEATVEYGLKHPELQAEFCEFLTGVIEERKLCPSK